MTQLRPSGCFILLILGLTACFRTPEYDTVILGAALADGTGGALRIADIGIRGDTIAFIGTLPAGTRAGTTVRAHGLVAAPGFINMLSWAGDTYRTEPWSKSDLLQGVTTEVIGEGWSEGPTLGAYFDLLERRGVSANVASYIGASTVRIRVLGHENRAPTPAELDSMRLLVDQAMSQGARGLSTALIYAPGAFAATDELVALAQTAAARGGIYASHIRSEGDRLDHAFDEVLTIAREAGIHTEIFHLKAAGERNWHRLPLILDRIEAARAAGISIAANIYPYTAASTSLTAIFPPEALEGGHRAWLARLRDPDERARLKAAVLENQDRWENFYALAGDPSRIVVVGFDNPALVHLAGKSLAEIAADRGQHPVDTAMDLILEDDSRVGAVYFLMAEADVRRILAKPWVSVGSDAGSYMAFGPALRRHPHPRAYGTFARILGHYVRDEGVLRLEDAVHRLTGLPATTLGLHRRGFLRVGHYADVVLFDAATIRDHATFARPHQYATGVAHVWVNGLHTIRDGRHTGARAGRALREPISR